MSEGPFQNTDREIWSARPGDYYADSIHVTDSGSIGINVGGRVVVMPAREWHALAQKKFPLDPNGKLWIGYCDLCNSQHCLQMLAFDATVERAPHRYASSASAPTAPPEALPEIERLKAENASLRSVLESQHKEWLEEAGRLIQDKEAAEAENASLLESLREKELYAESVRVRSVDYAQQLKESRAHSGAAEQRAEAAEKERDAWRACAEERGAFLEAAVKERDEARALQGCIHDDSAVGVKAIIEMRDAAEQRNTELEGAARHIAELGYDRATQGVRWCRFCGRNVNVGHARKMDGDTRPCPLGRLEKALAALHDEERSAPSRAEPPAGPSDSLSNSAAQGEEK